MASLPFSHRKRLQVSNEQLHLPSVKRISETDGRILTKKELIQ